MDGMFASLLDVIKRRRAKSPGRSSSIMEDMEKLRRLRVRLRAVLYDVERREPGEVFGMRWLRELRVVAYDAEDAIEKFEYELLRQQRACEEEEQAPIYQAKHLFDEMGMCEKRKVSGSLTAPPCDLLPLSDPSFQLQINSIIKEANDLLYMFARWDLRWCHRRWYVELDEDRLLDRVRCSGSFIEDRTSVVGREGDERKVINMLLDVDSRGRGNVRVVSVVGMGGVGKTTLAQLIYRDDTVVRHFEKRLWVCVSDDFDVVRLTRQILENILIRTIRIAKLDHLQRMLGEELKGKRFLLILDGVWNESRANWDILCAPLLSGEEGSRVLITTRSGEVSRISGVSEKSTYRLGCLSHADSWSLFEKHAFRFQKSRGDPNMRAIGQQIVRKCEGLPLAVIEVARFLYRSEDNECEWKLVSECELSDVPGLKEGILSTLKSSYDHLPPGIKPCFAYCAGFPMGHNFDREELVVLWMAQGYIPRTRRSMEENGWSYFEHLLQGSFFQYHRGECFKMHDFIHHLARSVSCGECSQLVGGKLPDQQREACHIWFEGEADMMRLLTCQVMDNFQHLKTLYMIGKNHRAFSSKVLDDMFLHMGYLRALDLGAAELTELPHSIGGLMHLRYLCISGRELRRLPESLGNLLYLQTLIVKRAHSLEGLPLCLSKLVNLRYLKMHKF